MTVLERTKELVGAGVPPVDALLSALRPPRHLVRDDGSPRRSKGSGTGMQGLRDHSGQRVEKRSFRRSRQAGRR